MKKIILLVVCMIFLSSFAFAGVKEDLLVFINQERNLQGAANLSFESSINNAAQLHSDDMLAQDYFSHTSLDGRNMVDRMNDAGFFGMAYGENLAAHTGQANASQVFEMWKNSSGHYLNMINSNFNAAGIGIAEGNWDNFGGLYSSIYTLNLGKISGSYNTTICTENSTRICGVNNVGECKTGVQTCTNNSWGVCDGAINPVAEICIDGKDNDCDGRIDENCVNLCDKDADKFVDLVCGGNDCNDNNKQININSTEVCNGIDEDCDGGIDEDCSANLEILSPENNFESNNSRVKIELNVVHLNGYVYYKINNGNWLVFCVDASNCQKNVYLSNGNSIIQIKLSDFNNIVYTANLSIFVDSIKPRILSQIPRNLGYTNGTFSVKYSESNLQSVDLYLSFPGESFILAASKTDCENGSNKICNLTYDLSPYNGQEVRYYFSISDKFSSVSSNTYTAKVDSAKPEFLWVNANKTSVNYERYKLSVNMSEYSKLQYSISNGVLQTMCSRCKIANRYFSFSSKPDYIDLFATDAAGNSNSYRIEL